MLNYLYARLAVLANKLSEADEEDWCTGDVMDWVNEGADLQSEIYQVEEALWASMGAKPLYYCENWDS